MYGLYALGSPIPAAPPKPNPLAAARYSCVYWVDHLLKANNDKDIQDGGHIHLFLRQKYLYWLEALSLLGSMSHGVLSMSKLCSLLQVR